MSTVNAIKCVKGAPMSIFKRSAPELQAGNMMFSNKALFRIMMPLFLQQVLAILVSTVDSIMVSYAGEAAVSGVSLVGSLDVLLIIFFTAMTAGGSVVVAQFLGKKDIRAVNEAAKQLVYIATIVAAVVTTVVLILKRPLLNLLFGDAEADVMDAALDYFSIIALSFPLLAITEGVGAVFRTSGNTSLALLISLIVNLLNVGGNALFIMGMNMGAAGAALSTLIARAVGAVIFLVLITNKKREIFIDNILKYKPDFDIIKKILRIGVPNGIESAMFQFGKLLTQSLISTMGTAMIAANAVASTISGYQYTTGNACRTTMITVVGRCIGAGEREQAKYYSKKLTLVNYAALWCVILFTGAMLSPIVSLYDISAEAASQAKELVLYHCLCAAIMWPIAFTLPSTFRAAGDVNYSMVVSMFSMWVFRVGGSYIMALETVSVFGLFEVSGFGLGVFGVWMAMTVDWVFRTVLFAVHYARGKWLTYKRL